MEDGPEGGGEEEGAGEGETGGAPTTPDGAAEDEFFDEGGTDGDAKVEEDGVLGGLAHGDHGFIGAIDSEMGSDEAEDEGAGDGGGSPDRPVPPFGFGVAEVVPAGPAGAGFADEPAGGTDEEDGDEGDEAEDVAIGGEGEEGCFDFFGIEVGDAVDEHGDADANGHDELRSEEEDDGPEEGPPTIPWGFGKGWGKGGERRW